MAPVPESNTTDEQQPAAKKRCGFFSALIDAPVHDVIPSRLQGERDYLTTSCLPEEEDPLSYRKCHASKYPSLAKLAPNSLCIPASYAPVERVFSIGGKIFCMDRCHLTDVNIENIMFMKCNEQDS